MMPIKSKQKATNKCHLLFLLLFSFFFLLIFIPCLIVVLRVMGSTRMAWKCDFGWFISACTNRRVVYFIKTTICNNCFCVEHFLHRKCTFAVLEFNTNWLASFDVVRTLLNQSYQKQNASVAWKTSEMNSRISRMSMFLRDSHIFFAHKQSAKQTIDIFRLLRSYTSSDDVRIFFRFVSLFCTLPHTLFAYLPLKNNLSRSI